MTGYVGPGVHPFESPEIRFVLDVCFFFLVVSHLSIRFDSLFFLWMEELIFFLEGI